MDIIKGALDIFNFTQNPASNFLITLLTGGSVSFALYKIGDNLLDSYLKRMNPEKFFNRLKRKSEFFADYFVKGIRFFDDRILDPIKNQMPKTGAHLEDALVGVINEVEAIFSRAFDRARLIVKDKK